ncbi:hypothetical protein PFISCL1PPCAC_18451, partial [Pristionchus fissidentatus]
LFIASAFAMEGAERNVCALKCGALTDPSPPVFQTGCSRVLYNGTVTDNNGKWNCNRQVYECPECGVFTHVITTMSNVSLSFE